MPESSPTDLAVAFRSFRRRLDEALAGADDDPERAEAASALVPRLEQVVSEAARVTGVSGQDLGGTAAAVAAHIERVAPDEWDDATLDSLRDLAVRAGVALRAIEDAARGT
jgi:hypothetical protein